MNPQSNPQSQNPAVLTLATQGNGDPDGAETRNPAPASNAQELERKLEQWRNAGAGQAVRVIGAGGSVTEGEVFIQSWSQRERLLRALMFGAGCFGLAICSLPIMGLHFILVPGFLIATPFVAVAAYRQPSVVLGGLAPCPKCHAPLAIVRQKVNWPLKDVCSSCYENVKIEERS